MSESPIDSVHVHAGARFVDFGGWRMPVQYSSVLEEHAAVRSHVGIFDVSHLGRFEVSGVAAVDLVRSQLCNDITRIAPGRAQYTMALNPSGGVEDDIIVWWLEDDRLWVMPNGTNSDGIVARFASAAGAGTTVSDVRTSTALFAVQGPIARQIIQDVVGTMPGRFRLVEATGRFGPLVVAGTGYTGEPGGEIAVGHDHATDLWHALVDAGAVPAGLGARDTLRLEMGYPLWGQDLDATTTPFEAGLGWAVAMDHEFVGRAALEAHRGEAPTRRLVAFTTQGRAIPRPGYLVTTGSGTGTVTSGNFSPTLGHGIGLAYIAPPPGTDESLTVEIRGRDIPAEIVDLPFLDR